MAILSTNPATGEKLGEFKPLSPAEIERRIERASEAFARYRKMTLSERSRRILQLAQILEDDSEKWARLMTQEMGKTIQAARDEAQKCALCCRYYAENAARLLSDRIIPTGGDRSFVRFQPLGPILAVMPWNFPFWQVFRFAIPTLLAGNVALLKHASNVPRCALAIEEIFDRADFPEAVFQSLLIPSSEVYRVLEDPRVKAVSLTGSEAAGIQVARASGQQLKKAVLELGGSDPFIVMSSAPLRETVRMAVRARTINNGQSCIAAKRFILAEEIADEFESRFVEEMKSLKVGDPMDESVRIGPLATREALEILDRQVRDSARAGARVLIGGRRLDRPGNFYAPTVLTEIPRESPAHHEEIFGPVALLFRARDLREAIRIANDTKYGLGASFWSTDQAEQDQFIEEIEAGMAFVNEMVASDPRLPFGGVKHSGYGRELGEFGVHEFVDVKTVRIRRGAPSEQGRTGVE